jgi:hypothetical protein
LVEEILDRFEAVLPEGVFLEIRGGRLSVHAPWGDMRANPIGELGVLPWLPMPRSRKFELAVQGVVEEVAKLIGYGVRADWPVAEATVDVNVVRGRIEIFFRAGDPPRAVLALEPFRWDGSLSEPPLDRSLRGKGERRFIGRVPPGHIEKVAESERAAAERSAALKDLHAAVKLKAKGMSSDQVRLLLRTEYQQRGLEPPSQGGGMEDFAVGVITASESSHPRVSALPVLAKGVHDLFQSARTAFKDDDDEEEETPT